MTGHLVDTDWLIDALNDKRGAREALKRIIENGELAVSIIVYAEVIEGLLSHPFGDLRRVRFDEIIASARLISPDTATAIRFAELRAELRAAGNIIGDHDLWVAATALEHDLTLMSRDAHFDRIRGLRRYR